MAVSLVFWPYFRYIGRIILILAVFMNNKQKKVAVLTALRGQSQPIQLPELLKILGPEFAERSVRRWLSDLVSNGQVEKIGQKRATQYRVIIESKQTIMSLEKSFV